MIREHDAALNSSYTDDFKRNPNQAKVLAELGYSSLFFSLLSRVLGGQCSRTTRKYLTRYDGLFPLYTHEALQLSITNPMFSNLETSIRCKSRIVAQMKVKDFEQSLILGAGTSQIPTYFKQTTSCLQIFTIALGTPGMQQNKANKFSVPKFYII